ncbi:hypothetical protein JCM10213_003936 [Rhodosporidiobolus nylandii]
MRTLVPLVSLLALAPPSYASPADTAPSAAPEVLCLPPTAAAPHPEPLSRRTDPNEAPTPPLPLLSRPPALKGRFLHLTDLHPDPHYRVGASEDKACHFKQRRKKKKGKKGKNRKGGKELAMYEEEDEEKDDGELEELKKDKPREAGYWGLPISDCDTPLTLINATFDWLKENFRGEVDFVVWTGDNARHDIDTRLPRSLPEILDLNSYILDRMRDAFGEETTLVASIGNNDIYPHNVMFPGPSKITNSFLSLWTSSPSLIPEHQQHTFARGGYYSHHPPQLKDELLLVSLNTLYFFDRNTVVDGCPASDDDFHTSLYAKPWLAAAATNASSLPAPSSAEAAAQFSGYISSIHKSLARDMDPGTEQLLWLEQQLVLSRAKGTQVYLTGHVPASKGNWYEGCWRRYSELVGEYGDVVLGQLFGHMNVDHFSFVTPKDAQARSALTGSSSPMLPATRRTLFSLPSLPSFLLRSSLTSTSTSTFDGDEDEPVGVESLTDDLFSLYSSLPSPSPDGGSGGGAQLDGYAVSHVNPSVIPTYLPGIRVWEYNISRPSAPSAAEDEEHDGWWTRLLTMGRKGKKRGKKGRKGKKGHRKSRFANAPSRRNAFLTPLAYTQYYLPESALSAANAAAAVALSSGANSTGGLEPPQWQVEYTTLSSSAVAGRLLASGGTNSSSSSSDPLFLPTTLPAPLAALLSHPPSGTTRHALRRLLKKLHLTPYDSLLRDGRGLTLQEWVRAARGLRKGGRSGKEWKAFRDRMGVGSGEL